MFKNLINLEQKKVCKGSINKCELISASWALWPPSQLYIMDIMDFVYHEKLGKDPQV